MKFVPMLFSTEMVQSILAGRKNQTRRVVKPQPDDDVLWNDDKFPRSFDSKLKGWNGTVNETGESKEFRCPYGQVGDVLWVREKFSFTEEWDDIGQKFNYFYAADYEDSFLTYKPSIHMPKEACRLFLKIKDIRVERVNEISEADAISEGIKHDSQFNNYECYLCGNPNGFHIGATNMCDDGFYSNPIDSFASLWSSINSQASWQIGVWVWVIEFERIDKPENFC